MPYSDFTLKQIKQTFGIRIEERKKLFEDIATQPASDSLITILEETIPLALAIDTEKARSELMITPVLLEVRRRSSQPISLFSGTEFTVDQSIGLNGYCDYILSRSPEQLTLNAPIFMIAEAKNENIKAGLGQCLAEMLAAQQFNQTEGNEIALIHGAVTTGEIWKFMKLEGTIVAIDLLDYYLPRDLDKILGILLQ
jgi:hypothetical protein